MKRYMLLCLICGLFFTGCDQQETESSKGETSQAVQDVARKEGGDVMAGMGIMVGEMTAASALVQLRLTKKDKLVDRDVEGTAVEVEFSLLPEADLQTTKENSKAASQVVKATAEHDFLTRVSFTELKAGTRYVCQTRLSSDGQSWKVGPMASFKTLPGKDSSTPVSFVVVTGMNYAKFHGDDRIDREQHVIQNNTELPKPYEGKDKHLGYPALETILSLKPDFFIGTGDNVYYDTPTDPRAKTITEMRQKWHEQFVQLRYIQLFAVVPTYWEIDDHDFRVDDCDNTGDYEPSPAVGRRVALEQLPYAPADAKDVKTYRTHRVSRDLQIWLTENRMYRSPNKMKDGPEKTIWGAEQKDWLKQTLKSSDATFKLLISPTPMIGPDDLRKTDNHCDIGGFQHERDEFFAWLKESGIAEQNFYIVCGDRHWQYRSIHPSGIEEFSCGALVDANSRLGRKPGDPKSTDPDALIKQPYYQDPRSGGFLLIKSLPAADNQPETLTFLFHDEHGKLLHENTKTNKH